MKDEITVDKEQLEGMFRRVNPDGFHFEKLKDGKTKVYSMDPVHWMFRRVTKNDKGMGKPRIEIWRYMSNGRYHVDKSQMVRQFSFGIKEEK